MRITKEIRQYIVHEAESIARALNKINDNKSRIVFIVNDGGFLIGSFTDGDFRRWATRSSELNLNLEIGTIVNGSAISKPIGAQKSEINKLFGKGVDVIPLTDVSGRVQALAFPGGNGFTIGRHNISEDSRAFVIAEIGNNHNGDVELAKHMVELAADAGADCVKFQMRDMDSLYKSGSKTDDSADLGAQYTMDLLSRFQLSTSELFDVFDYCKKLGLPPMCTPWDARSLELLENYGMEAYKVASADLTNHELLASLVDTRKPLICSTGMSTELEIQRTAQFLRERGASYVMLHCNSTYPTPYKDVNLSYLPRLKEISDGPVGYSGHERGIAIPVAAVAMGACVVEKHFTVNREMEGNDHKVSLLPDEFKEMVKMIRSVEESFGNGDERQLSQGEMINRETLAKSLVTVRNIEKGEIITDEMLAVKSPGQGLQPMYRSELVGRKATRNLFPGDYFYESDLKDNPTEARLYKFNRPFGIPVRYHDYRKLVSSTNVDFVEFHLSYKDLELSTDEFFDVPEGIGFAIHAPELFSGDHIMDLASGDEVYLNRSIDELSRVCRISADLKKFFPKTLKPVVVINAGGYTTAGFLSEALRPVLYDRVGIALSKIKSDGVEPIIQTMPPFPWHFGGQSYHNIFVDADEIVNFCNKYSVRICLDISHSMMACNYYGWDIVDFVKKVAPYVAHMHIVDAKGVDGEGIQIGQGDVDFTRLSKVLNERMQGIQFIPEVWQGHKNNGEGFWNALEFLESHLG